MPTIITANSVTDLSQVPGTFLEIEGDTTIVSFGGNCSVSEDKIILFSGEPRIVHGDNLILPSSRDIQIESGDIVRVSHLGDGQWILTSFARSPKTLPLEITLLRHAAAFSSGPVSSAEWKFTGAHLTASTTQLYAQHLRGLKLIHARWLIAWNPNGTGGNNSGARLIHADLGPSNIVEISRIERNTSTPRVDGVDITAQMQALIDSGKQKTLGFQSYGNGMRAADFSLSVIEVLLK